MPAVAVAGAGWDAIREALPPDAHAHVVQFYEDEAYLFRIMADFVADGLRQGSPAVVIATEPHQRGLFEQLASLGIDVPGAIDSARLTMVDARECLATFMVDGIPDWDLFRRAIGGLLGRLAQGGGRIHAYGEMVDLLWRDGNPNAAIRVEEMWNDLAGELDFELLCTYVMGNFYQPAHGADFERICDTHSHVIPAESFTGAGAVNQLREVSTLQQRARALEHELEERKKLEQALRAALAERKRADDALRESQQDLMDFLDNAAEGIHSVGPDGIIQWANRAELELLGYTREEYVGRHIADFYVDRVACEVVLARLGRNETLKDNEATLRCKNGEVKHVLINSNARFRDGKLLHTRCFTRDVTDRKRAEAELLRQHEELKRTVHFSELFVGILGHDLRNPLSAITTAASLLARRSDSEQVTRPAARILKSSERIGRMIDDLLDFTRIRLGKGLRLAQQDVDLAELCRTVIDELDGGATSPLTLDSRGDVVGTWDGDRLGQVLSNLIGNALTHGEASAPVTIRIDGEAQESIGLEVRNAGTVAADLLPVLFEPFRGGDGELKQERSTGLGLGLHISQQIVLAHGGTIEVTSSPEAGTCFRVTLPRRSTDAGAAFRR